MIEYLYIPVSVLFFCVFVYFVVSASENVFALYSTKPKPKPKPKRFQLNISSKINNVNSTINKDKDDEQKEYEENISPLPAAEHYMKTNDNIYDNTNDDNTTTLAYFLELQSRLQHLQSLLNTDINKNTFHSVDTYYRLDENKQDNKPKDIITEIHSNNMKLIENTIQNVIYNKSHNNMMENDKDFYNKLNNNNEYDTNWSKSREHKRKPSIEHKIYKNINYSFNYSLEYIVKMTMKLINNFHVPHLLTSITSVTLLYSCGVLYYCIENNLNVNIFAYIFGIILVFMVMIIAYFFDISSMNRNTNYNEFIIAIISSFILIYFALFWISYYFNATVTFILIMVIILSYQYKHNPINAKQRNFDEIWVCLLLNCCLPLFAYYLQLPEIQKFQQLQSQTPELVVEKKINVIDVEIENWLTYILNIIYYIITWIFNDFWSMMDITYALDEPQLEATKQEQLNETQTNETETNETNINIIDEIDDTLYWWNKLFYIFPYKLFNIILVSWFITHSSLLIRNVSLYKTVNIKLLYFIEICFAYILSIIFWYNNMFDITFFYWMIISIPWTIGLLRHIWEHKNIQNDQSISKHAEIFNLWFYITIYLSFVYNWIYQNGIFYSLFSPNLLIVVAPFYFIIQCIPKIVNEFVWSTDF